MYIDDYVLLTIMSKTTEVLVPKINGIIIIMHGESLITGQILDYSDQKVN